MEEQVKRDPLQIITELLNIATKKGIFDLEQVAAGIASINAISNYIETTKSQDVAGNSVPQGEGLMTVVQNSSNKKKRRNR